MGAGRGYNSVEDGSVQNRLGELSATIRQIKTGLILDLGFSLTNRSLS